MTEATPRRLRGHKGTTTCCIASRDHPGLVATAGEDGYVCWFDMRCKDAVCTMEAAKEAVSSLCFKPGNEDIIYVSSGKEVKSFDVHQGNSWKPLETYTYSKEEINQISCSSKSSFLAAADDGGDVKIIDVSQQCLFKTLRAGHSSICSSVQFLPWRPWEVITGGLDSKLIMWDFSKGRPYKSLDFGMPDQNAASNSAQCFNPAFVHAIAVPEGDMLDNVGQVCVVARGDGVVDVIDMESELAATRPKQSNKSGKGAQTKLKDNNAVSGTGNVDQNQRKRLQLDYSVGGHTAAVSCVAFSVFGERGRFIISGGNDKSIKVWNFNGLPDAGQDSGRSALLRLNVDLNKKVNWLCTTPSETENLVVCDTTKVVKVYTIS